MSIELGPFDVVQLSTSELATFEFEVHMHVCLFDHVTRRIVRMLRRFLNLVACKLIDEEIGRPFIRRRLAHRYHPTCVPLP